MTPEQIDKEKAEKVAKAPVVQPGIEKPKVNSVELSKMQPVDTTPPKESARQFAKSVGDYRRVVQMAKEKGVDLDNIGEMPLMDSDKGKITDAVKSAYGRELATGIQGISDAITAPQNEERNKIDTKAMMALEKQKRRGAWADALYAFGEGLQGKTANQDAFVTTKIQRNQDKQFQDFKDTTERNQKTKYLWENQSKKEMIDWAEGESKNMRETEKYRQEMKNLADKYAQDQKDKERGYKIQEDRNNISRNKKPAGSAAKGEKTIKVQTAQKTYELKQEQADFYKGEILKNADALRKKYPGWFTESQSIRTNKQTGEEEKGPITYRLNPEVSEVDMIRAYLEDEEIKEQHKNSNYSQFNESKNNLQKIYKERGDLNERPTQPKQTIKPSMFQ